jgi:y4mF family transcriptional regulator
MAKTTKSSERPRTALDLAAEKAAGGSGKSAHDLSGLPAFQMRGSLSASRIITSTPQLGEFVASRRKAKKLNQQDFGDLAGVGRRFVSELEGGKETAQIGKVIRVLQALGIDLVVRDR